MRSMATRSFAILPEEHRKWMRPVGFFSRPSSYRAIRLDSVWEDHVGKQTVWTFLANPLEVSQYPPRFVVQEGGPAGQTQTPSVYGPHNAGDLTKGPNKLLCSWC